MPIDISVLSKKLGLPETAFESEQTFEQAFSDPKTGYIPRAKIAEDEGAKKHFTDMYGKRFGQMESLVKNVWKDLEVDEVEGETVEDFIKDGAKKAKARLQKAIEDASKSTDSRFTELQTQAAEFKVKWESEKERAEKTNALLKEKEQEFEGYKTSLKLESILGDAFKQVELIPDITEIQRRGLNDLIKEQYEFRVGDGTGEVWDRKTGKPAMNEAGNVPVKVHEAIKSIADKNNLLKKNNLNRDRTTYTAPSNGGNDEAPSRVDMVLKRFPRLAGS